MASNNGDWVKWILGILITISLAISGYHFNIAKAMAEHIIKNDEDARCRDDIIKTDLVKSKVEQSSINTQILIALAEIRQDVKYLREKNTR